MWGLSQGDLSFPIYQLVNAEAPVLPPVIGLELNFDNPTGNIVAPVVFQVRMLAEGLDTLVVAIVEDQAIIVFQV